MPPQSAIQETHAVTLLTSQHAGQLLAAMIHAVGPLFPGSAASQLPKGSWQLIQLNHRPGAGVTGVFSVTTSNVHNRQSPTHTPPRTETMVCVSTASMPPHVPVITIDWEGQKFAGWVWPDDPWLPGLHHACHPTPELVGHRDVRSIRVGYRPTRRAVFRVIPRRSRHHHAQRDTRPVAYIKVVRPTQETRLLHRHHLLADAHMPVPRVIGSSGHGAVALTHCDGLTAAQVFSRNPNHAVSPEHLIALLDRLPEDAIALPRRPSWSERAQDHARAAADALPHERERINSLAQRIHEAYHTADEPVVATHGDFHPGNILLGPHAIDPTLGPITGLLDVDSVGPGQLSDDLGCYLAHLWALAADLAPQDADTYIQPSINTFDELVDPADLRTRTAGVLLSLIAGAERRHGKRAAIARLTLAEDCMDQSQRLR